MQTADYIKAKDIIFMAAGFAGDPEFKVLPRGMYISLISDAFRELNMDSFFMEARFETVLPEGHLTIPLPGDCFNVKNVYIYDGDVCDYAQSKKVWWKRNYYTNGGGYIANDKGYNGNDPYYTSHSSLRENKALIRYQDQDNINNVLYYNIQNGNLMLSASCRAAGKKVHIHYNSTGCDVDEAPIIPRFFKQAIEDYTTEAALRFRAANEPANARNWLGLSQAYTVRLDKEGMNGSWHNAIMRVRKMSSAQRADLSDYLGKAAWATGR